MAKFFKFRNTSKTLKESDDLEREDITFARLGSAFAKILGLLNLRVTLLENCICPCNIARWDTPTSIEYGANVWTPIEYQSEVLRGKMCTSDSTDGWVFTASKEGVYLVEGYIRITLTGSLTSEVRFALIKNKDLLTPWSEIDHQSRVGVEELHQHGFDLINLKRGETVQIAIDPATNPIQNIVTVYGYVHVSYQCDYQDEINVPEPLIGA